MCVICGYEIAGTWVRNDPKWYGLGAKWYEFWVRNGMPGVGISPRICITSILQYMPGGGGGVLGIYIGGGVPWHTKKGGVLGAGTAQKGGS